MHANRPLRVLFVCTGNSARSQIAEALLNHKGAGRFAAESAGVRPAAQVSSHALTVLREAGIDWSDRTPRGVAGLELEPWDLVITVCDRAKESCPVFLGDTAVAHWGLPDPADVTGAESEQLAAFRATLRDLERRVARLVALPVERLGPAELQAQVQTLAAP